MRKEEQNYKSIFSCTFVTFIPVSLPAAYLIIIITAPSVSLWNLNYETNNMSCGLLAATFALIGHRVILKQSKTAELIFSESSYLVFPSISFHKTSRALILF